MVTTADCIYLSIGIGFFIVLGFTSYFFLDVVDFTKSRINSKFYMQKNESEDNENTN